MRFDNFCNQSNTDWKYPNGLHDINTCKQATQKNLSHSMSLKI